MATDKTPNKLDLLRDYAILFGMEDWVDVRIIADSIAEELSLKDRPKTVHDFTMKIVSDLLLSGDMAAGDLGGSGFEAWVVEPEEALRRIEERWQEIGERLPDINEIAWLNLTDKGEKRARTINADAMLKLKVEQVD